MSEEVIPSESELYNDIVEMLSNGNFLQLNGKAINLTELNEYINAQGREIERLNNIIKEVREYIDYFLKKGHTKNWKQFEYSLLEILDKGSEKE